VSGEYDVPSEQAVISEKSSNLGAVRSDPPWPRWPGREDPEALVCSVQGIYVPLSNSAAHSSVTVMAGEEWVPNFNLKMVNILRGGQSTILRGGPRRPSRRLRAQPAGAGRAGSLETSRRPVSKRGERDLRGVPTVLTQ